MISDNAHDRVEGLSSEAGPVGTDLDDSIGVTEQFRRLAFSWTEHWDGRVAVSALKEADFNWRQMEWPGFYFEHLVRTDPTLEAVFGEKAERVANTAFDGFAAVPWDLKVHVSPDRSGDVQTRVILNDEDAMEEAVDTYGSVCLAIMMGSAVFDEDGSFYDWHESLKGRKSAYQLANPERRRRVRKSAFVPSALEVFQLTAEDLPLLGRMNQGRNSNGEPRPPKFMLELDVRPPDWSFPVGAPSA